MLKSVIVSLILVISLAACGGNETSTAEDTNTSTENITDTTNDTTNDAANDTATVEEITFFTAVVTGDRAREFADIATFTCTDGGENAPRFQIINMNDDDTRSTISLSMPAFAEPGTYPLTGQTIDNYGEGFTIEVFFDREIAFNVVQEGSVTLDAIATGPGEPVQGRFEATMTDEDGTETATISAEFDFMSISEEEMERVGYTYDFLYCAPTG